jgi:hypothetical protein
VEDKALIFFIYYFLLTQLLSPLFDIRDTLRLLLHYVCDTVVFLGFGGHGVT